MDAAVVLESRFQDPFCELRATFEGSVSSENEGCTFCAESWVDTGIVYSPSSSTNPGALTGDFAVE